MYILEVQITPVTK